MIWAMVLALSLDIASSIAHGHDVDHPPLNHCADRARCERASTETRGFRRRQGALAAVSISVIKSNAVTGELRHLGGPAFGRGWEK